MRLLLDEMYGPTLAQALRSRGHDAEALTERSERRSLPDAAALRVATDEGRVIATEDVGDFAQLHVRSQSEGFSHAGIILIPARRFPHSRNGLSRLTDALDDFLDSPPSPLPESFLWWLA